MNDASDKPEDTVDTVTKGNEPEEVTFSVNDVFNSFDELDKKIKQYEGKRRFNYGRGIRERSKLLGNELIDIWISELSFISSLTPVFMAEGSFRPKEKEREPLIKSGMVLVPSTIKYLNYEILCYCFLFVVEPLEKVPLHYH